MYGTINGHWWALMFKTKRETKLDLQLRYCLGEHKIPLIIINYPINFFINFFINTRFAGVQNLQFFLCRVLQSINSAVYFPHRSPFVLRSFSVRSPFVLRSSSVDPPFALRSRSVRAPFALRSRSVRESKNDLRINGERTKKYRTHIGFATKGQRNTKKTNNTGNLTNL